MNKLLAAAVIAAAFALPVHADNLADLQAISKQLDARKKDLDNRERNVSTKEQRLKALEDNLIQKEGDIRKMQAAVTARLKEIKVQEDANLDKLAKGYNSAKAKSAAMIIVKMDLDKAVQLFLRLPAMTAGKILSAMGTIDAAYAAKISEKLTPDKIQGVQQ